MKIALAAVFAAAISAHPLVNDDILEPSVLNEVEHALARAPTNNPPCSSSWRPFTNSVSATEIAVKLVSTQRSDGRWVYGTNDVTEAALRILRELEK